MDLFSSQSDSLVAAIRAAGAQSVEALGVDAWVRIPLVDVVTAEKERRPPGHMADSRAFAQRYLGNQGEVIRSALRDRYPLSYTRMPVAPLPYIRQWARADSGCYQNEATRSLVLRATREVLSDTDPRAVAFPLVVDDARVSEVAPECERRARTGVKSTAVHVVWMPPIGDADGRAVAQHYWPHDVLALSHPSYPTEDEALIFVALRQADGRWLGYRRLFTEVDGVVDVWGPWEMSLWAEGYEERAVWREYEGTILPVVLLRLEPGDGGVWPAAERDSYLVADQLNTSRANLEHVTDLQGHSNLLVASDTLDENDVGVAPDSLIKLRSGDTASWISPAPALEQMRVSIEEKQGAVAVARGNDASAYSATPGPAESGIARIVAKFPHELALRESREAVRRFDERLCRLVMDVTDSWGDTAFGDQVAPRTVLAASVVFEDPGAKQQRAVVNLDVGAISPAQYAVEIGLFPSVEKAAEAGYSTLAAMQAPAVVASVSSSLASAVPLAAAAPTTEPAAAPTINELTLAIERSGRLGDVTTLNMLRRKLAEVLGSTYAGDVTAADLGIGAALADPEVAAAADAATVTNAAGE